jgi:hypothetical protein
MLRTTERTVHFYELTCTANSRKVQNPNCADISDIIQLFAATPGLKGYEIYKNNNVAVELADLDIKSDHGVCTLVLLLNRADRNVSDVTFKNFDNKTRRKAGKLKIDGIEASSYVLIRAYPGTKSCQVLMTMGAGVNTGHIERLFKEVVKSNESSKKWAHVFEFNHPSGAEKYKVKYSFECLGLKGSHLDEAFSKGSFQGFTLVAGFQEKFDASGNYVIKEQELEVVAPSPKLANPQNFRNSVFNYLKKSPIPYDRIRIRFKRNGDDEASATIPVNDLDAAFVKKDKIHFEYDIEDQSNKIQWYIVEKMMPLIL